MSTSFDQKTSSNNSSSFSDFSIRTMQDDLLKMQTTGNINDDSLKKPTFTQTPNESSFSKAGSEEKISSIKTPSPFSVSSEIKIAQPEKIEQKIPTPVNTKNENSWSTTASTINTPLKITAESPQKDFLATEEKPFLFKLVMGLIIIFVISIIALSGYYFWMTRSPKDQTPIATTPTPLPPTPTPIENTPAPIEAAPNEKYSGDKPNYLVLDLNTLSSDDIQASISKVAEELKNTPTTSNSAYEFTVVDTNNNPVAFQIFATAANLKFSQAILSSLGSDFSLFIYKDAENMKSGLSLLIKDKDVLNKELPMQEKTFPANIMPLFMGSATENTNTIFKDGSYNDIKTRYLNLNSTGTLSIDYAITKDKFVLGTSKNTLRAIIDKQSATLNIPTTAQPENMQTPAIDSNNTINSQPVGTITQNTPTSKPVKETPKSKATTSSSPAY